MSLDISNVSSRYVTLSTVVNSTKSNTSAQSATNLLIGKTPDPSTHLQ